jgi:hypothetical protein
MGSDKTYIFDGGGSGGGLDIAALVSSMMGNKGMDPNLVAALMNGNNNRGAWGGDGCWWIWIILLFFCWGGFGGNGFGGNNANGLPAQLNGDAGRELLMNAIQGNGAAINQLASSLNCSTQQIQNTLCNIQGTLGMSSQQIINAVQAMGCQIGNQIAECCCNVRQDIVKMGYENQLATINQTNTLQSSASTQFNILGAKIDAQTQIINDRFCQLEMREMQNKIDTLRQENSNLALAASQQAQTANIVSQLRAPAPVPAYIVQNPNCCTTPTVAVTAAPACAGTLF